VLQRRPLAALAGVALLASCQPLPHPVAEDRPPAELLAVPESAGVAIAPLEGQPKAIAAELGAATAHALLGYDIPASEKTTGRGSYRLYGRITQSKRGGKSAVAVLWRLRDAKGREIGERGVGIEASPADWRKAGEAMVERLAALSARAVASLLVKDPEAAKLASLAESIPGPIPGPIPGAPGADTALRGPSPPKPQFAEPAAAKPAVPDLASARPAVPAPPAADTARKQESGRLRVAVHRVTGAPGNGASALAGALTSVLRQQDLTIVDPGGKADVTIDGEVSIAPAASGKQHVKIMWRVRAAGGAELGTVGQENDVPRYLLNGSWGDVAYAVAVAAGDGLLQVLARAAPPVKTDAAPQAAAAREAPKSGPEQPAGGKPSQPAAAAVKAAKTKE
jgi:hypothetical protein